MLITYIALMSVSEIPDQFQRSGGSACGTAYVVESRRHGALARVVDRLNERDPPTNLKPMNDKLWVRLVV